jgi:hypothetical protein
MCRLIWGANPAFGWNDSVTPGETSEHMGRGLGLFPQVCCTKTKITPVQHSKNICNLDGSGFFWPVHAQGL